MEQESHLSKTRKYLTDISGPGPGNRPKAHVVLRYYEQSGTQDGPMS